MEFHNVKWIKNGYLLINRNLIIDELFGHKNNNYEEISKVYNQLRKNYESQLLFNEASNFFIGELEAIKNSLRYDPAYEKRISYVLHSIYKYLVMYGESIFLPLFLWSFSTIIAFTLLRIALGINSTDYNLPQDQLIDSIELFFNCLVLLHLIQLTLLKE